MDNLRSKIVDIKRGMKRSSHFIDMRYGVCNDSRGAIQ